MKGSIRKRGDVYEYSFEVGRTAEGKRKRVSKSGFKSKNECSIALANAISEFDKTGNYVKESKISVAEYMYFYLEDYVKIHCRPNTLDLYKRTIDNYIIPELGHLMLYQVRPKDIKKLLDGLYKKKYSESTITTTRNVIGKAFRLAVYPYQYLKSDPAQYMKLEYKFIEEDKELFSLEEARNILFYFMQEYKHNYFIPLIIAFHTGCRRSEILAMRFTDDSVDLDNRIIHIKKQAQFKKGGVELVEPKTKSSKRDIIISEELHEILTNHKEFLDSIKVNHNFVCVNTHGDILNNNTARHALDIIKKITGKNIRFHDFRHLHGTLLCEKGCNYKGIQERLRDTLEYTQLWICM